MRKDLAVPRRGLSSSCPQPLRHRELKQLSHQRYNRLYVGKSISSPKLAATVAEILQLEEKARHEVIMECSPGKSVWLEISWMFITTTTITALYV